MKPGSLTYQILESHLEAGSLKAPGNISVRIDQALLQDATGTLVMLQLEAMKLDRAKILAAQYIDHNLLQADFKNPDDHLFLESAAKKFGIRLSRPGNGISHVVHQQAYGKPGATLIGSDSHTPAAGALGMIAFGAGGIDVAAAIGGRPYEIQTPKVWGVHLINELPDWVSAKDVILELLRRHSVRGGKGKIIEYFGPGVKSLSVMDRHVITNMGTELGATTSVFPADEAVQQYLKAQGREQDFQSLQPDSYEAYDEVEELDLSRLEPLIAMPSSPDNVVPVQSVAGETIYQSYIGSSANPGFRDFAVVAEVFRGRTVPKHVSLDVNVSSRQTLLQLMETGHLSELVKAGARIHQVGCNGCIGMGQAPATGEISLRTVPRNFPGRSGTQEDKVCLVSPETAAASALFGKITDPRTLDMVYPRIEEPQPKYLSQDLVGEAEYKPNTRLRMGPNIQQLPAYEAIPNGFSAEILLKVGGNISTDEILPAGSRVLPFRSNIDKISDFTFIDVDPDYAVRAKQLKTQSTRHIVVGAENYGQGSSREHAALALRHLGAVCVIANSFARIHRANLINYGVLPLLFSSDADYEFLKKGSVLSFDDVRRQIQEAREVTAQVNGSNTEIQFRMDLSPIERQRILSGGLLSESRPVTIDPTG